MAITTVVLILVMALPTPEANDADVEAFEQFCRVAWRAIVITVKMVVLMIAFAVACLGFGGDAVLVGIGYAVFGITGLRLFLWATEFIIPDGLHSFLAAKTDPVYLLKLVF